MYNKICIAIRISKDFLVHIFTFETNFIGREKGKRLKNNKNPHDSEDSRKREFLEAEV